MKKLFLLLYIVSCLGSPTPAHATGRATLTLQGPAIAHVSQQIHVQLLLDTNDAVNAGFITVRYPANLLHASSVNYQNSIFALWQQLPNASPLNGQVTLTGGIPNPGYKGKGGVITNIIFTPKAVGAAVIHIEKSSQLLLNDGEGTPAAWSSSDLKIAIKEEPKPTTPTADPPPTVEKIEDTTPPEQLELLLGHDSDLFSGDWFAVFSARDTGSGIHYFEIAETNPEDAYPEHEEWRKTTSPYRLLRQNENTKVFLKAVDNAGNSKVISKDHRVKPVTKKDSNSYQISLILIILLFLIILLLSLLKRKRGGASPTVQK